MKKILFAFAAFAAALAGCSKEVEIQTPEETNPATSCSVVTLHACVPIDSDTKVTNNNLGAYSWQAGDKITVFNDSGDGYEFSTIAGGTAVDFSSATFDGNLGTVAMYPASSNHAEDSYYMEPTFAWAEKSSLMPMIGAVDAGTQDVSFKAIGGVLKLLCFNVDDNARKFVISSESRKLTGSFVPAGSPAVISSAEKGDGDNKITITFGSGHPTDMVFYIPVPTGSLGRLTFVMKDGSDVDLSIPMTTKSGISASRNQIITAPALNCSSKTPIWSENFGSYSADAVPSGKKGDVTYSCTNGSGTTKIYTASLAGGTSPELLVGKSDGTFKVADIPTNSASFLALTYKQNGYALAVSFSSGVTLMSGSASNNSAGTKTLVLRNEGGVSKFDITFQATSSSNVRLDDIEVSSLASYSAPSITASPAELTIAVAAAATNTATSTITYSNAIDDLPIGVSVNAEASSWLSASLDGTTLTVSAAKKESVGSREGTVTLRASGVTKTITVTQPSAYVANPAISVTPGDGTFTAVWSEVDHVTAYAAFLRTDEGTPTDGTDLSGLISYNSLTGKYSLTKTVDNGDYVLYVKASTVETGYILPESYVSESFTCSDATPTFTITITQPASGGSITAKGQSASVKAEEDEEITLVATPVDGYKFVSWNVTKNSNGDAVSVSDNKFIMPAEAVTVTATFAAKAWVKVTNASTLQSGDKLMIVATVSGSSTPANNGTFAANGTISSSVMGKVSATITSDTLTSYTGSQEFTLGGSSGSWTLSNGSNLLGATAVKKLAWDRGTTTWSISITDGNATITNGEATYGTLLYNRDSPRFSTYTSTPSASMARPMLFRYE